MTSTTTITRPAATAQAGQSPEVTQHHLDELVKEISKELGLARRSERTALEHALKAGEKLNEAQALVRHGHWGKWLEKHFPGAKTTATNYMRLADNSATVADLPSVRDALVAIRRPSRRAQSQAQPVAEPDSAPGAPDLMKKFGTAVAPTPPTAAPEKAVAAENPAPIAATDVVTQRVRLNEAIEALRPLLRTFKWAELYDALHALQKQAQR